MKFYLGIYCTVCSIVLYCTGVCREYFYLWIHAYITFGSLVGNVTGIGTSNTFNQYTQAKHSKPSMSDRQMTIDYANVIWTNCHTCAFWSGERQFFVNSNKLNNWYWPFKVISYFTLAVLLPHISGEMPCLIAEDHQKYPTTLKYDWLRVIWKVYVSKYCVFNLSNIPHTNIKLSLLQFIKGLSHAANLVTPLHSVCN